MFQQFGLGCMLPLSAFFEGYGFGELVRAYRTVASDEWAARALPGVGGVTLGVVLALSTWQSLC
jgi:hypothetical protein